MREFARQQTSLLLGRLSVAVDRAAHQADAASIHDLRVAMRRRITALLAAAGAVRDCDIALDLVARAGIARRSALVAQLAAQRRKTGRDLLLEIRRWKGRDYPRRWRSRLEL